MIKIPDNLPYSSPSIECIRFGGRRGNIGIGCCAVDLIQGFNNPPSQIGRETPFYDGDTQSPANYGGGQLHICGTNEQMLLAYLTHGTFSAEPQSDHAFIAVMSQEQVDSQIGKEWLKILYREGFDYIATVNNSVYEEYHPVHIFMMIRTAGGYLDGEELCAPPEWEKLKEQKRETPEERFSTLLGIYQQAHEERTPPPSPYEDVGHGY